MTNDTQTSTWPGRRLSRRGFLLGSATTAGAAGVAIACGGGGDNDANGAVSQVTRGPVEQNKITRHGTGLMGYNPDKTFDGYTLFTSALGHSIYVIDMDGNMVKQLDVLDPEGQASFFMAQLLDNGNMLVLGNLPSGAAPVGVFEGGWIAEMDFDGNEIWRLDDEWVHHDVKMLPNGNLLILRSDSIPDEIAPRLLGGVPGTEGEHVWSDWVVEATTEGEVVWEWKAWEHLDPAEAIRNYNDTRVEWTHANSVEPMPNGDVIISMRNVNIVAIISRETGDITWQLTQPVVAQQHDATYLEGDRILIFDNGAHREDNALPYSRVIEVDIETKEIVWEYHDQALTHFYSAFISGAQRLPNGNTLICEGNFGRLFEVTAENEIVWEYISPHLVTNPVLGTTNVVYRSYRYPVDAFPAL